MRSGPKRIKRGMVRYLRPQRIGAWSSSDDWHGLLYATGIGGLLALCLRARGRFLQTPLLLQAPILWGLKYRTMPRLMRFGPLRMLLHWVFGLRSFQRRFVRKYFERPLSPAM